MRAYLRGLERNLRVDLRQHWPAATELIICKQSEMKLRISSTTQPGLSITLDPPNYKGTGDIYTLGAIHKQLPCTHFVGLQNKPLINIHPEKPLAERGSQGFTTMHLFSVLPKKHNCFRWLEKKKKIWMQLKDQEREIECFLPPPPPSGYELASKWINTSAAWSKLNSGAARYPQVSPHHSWLCSVKL